MNDIVLVSLEERVFHDLSAEVQTKDIISPLLKNTLDKIKDILSERIIDIELQNQTEQEKDNKYQTQKLSKVLLCDLRPLLLKAAILLDNIESIRIIMSYVEFELSNNITLLNNKINYSIIAKYAIEKKHLDLLDCPLIFDTIEKVLFKNKDYKLKIFLESDVDIISKITSKNSDIFNGKLASEQVSIADLSSLYKKSFGYI
jgi:hypothetical protein